MRTKLRIALGPDHRLDARIEAIVDRALDICTDKGTSGRGFGEEGNLSIYSNIEDLGGYLKAIIHNLVANEIKKDLRRDRRRRDVFAKGEARQPPGPLDASVRSEGQRIVREVLFSMDEKHREILVLSHMLGFSVKDQVEILGAPEGTVKRRGNRARERFRRLLESRDIDLSNHVQ
jgi:RNA polymerase sigma factor (sigma-70 family)